MEELLIAQHTVSRVCHSIANSVNIIKFILEDLMNEMVHKNLQDDTIKHLIGQVDALSVSMDFFRNLYSSADSKNNVLKIACNICKRAGIKISETTKSAMESINNHKVEKAVASIMFLLAKSTDENCEIKVNICEDKITIHVQTSSNNLKNTFIKMREQISNYQEPSYLNILTYYTQRLIGEEGYCIKAEDGTGDNDSKFIIGKTSNKETTEHS